MAEQLTPTQLVEVLREERRKEWQKGHRILAESYLQKYPTLQDDPQNAVELVYHEILLREEMGETPQLDEYIQRFPQFSTQLEPLFEVHRAIEGGNLFNTPSMQTSRNLTPGEFEEGPSTSFTTIPGYEILGRLGRGGMGVVYKALQKGLNRIVALKMILAGPEAEEKELARFRAEAEAQARLQHPNIVQIYEIGAVDGRPYFALEYVDGGSLETQLASTPQPARSSALLVETLARAIHYAHQQGLVHRDLKPSNILLQKELTAEDAESAEKTTEKTRAKPKLSPLSSSALSATSAVRWTPKITDFGLAKRLETEGSQTKSGTIMGTPNYMAPEQTGEHPQKIGPAADVYALGVILYEMLTGRPPFLAETALETILQARSLEPVPPHRLQPKVPRDLETICMKCLQKEPAKRYGTAEALAEDLRRFQSGEPIKARPVGPITRWWRWCRRKPVIATLTAALILVFFGGLLGVLGQWQRAERHRRMDEESFRQAREAVDELFIHVSEEMLLNEPFMEPLRKKLLQAALKYHQRFLQQRVDDPDLQADLAVTYFRIAKITQEIATPEEALEAFQNSRSLYEKLAAARPKEARFQAGVASCLASIGRLQRTTGKWKPALDSFLEGQKILEDLLGSQTDLAEYRVNLARIYHDIGYIHSQMGEFPKVLPFYQKSLDLREKLVEENPNHSLYQLDLAGIYRSLGHISEDLGNWEDTLTYYQKAHLILAKLAEENPHLNQFQFELSVNQTDLGTMYGKKGEPAQALKFFGEAVTKQEKLAQNHPAYLKYQERLALNYRNKANCLKDSNPEEAIALYEKAIIIGEKLAQEYATVPEYRKYLGGYFYSLGFIYQATNRFEEALARYKKSQTVGEQLCLDFPNVQQYQTDLSRSYHGIGSTLTKMKQLDEALDYFEKARRTEEKMVRENPEFPQYQFELASTLFKMGDVHGMAGRQDQAILFLEYALPLRKQLAEKQATISRYQNDLAVVYLNLGNIHHLEKQWEETLRSCGQALPILEKLVDHEPHHLPIRGNLWQTYRLMALAQKEMGELEKALELNQRGIMHARFVFAKEPRNPANRSLLSIHLQTQAMLLREINRLEEATAIAVERAALWPQNPAELFLAGCEITSCIPLVGKNKSQASPDEQAQREHIAQQAVKVLHQAIEGGFKDIEKFKTQSLLDPLRKREDFQKILGELEAKIKSEMK